MNDPLHALPAGHRLGGYRIERVLGSGGFGITYYARDIDIGKLVAIKEYLPNEFALRTGTGAVAPKSADDQAHYQWGLERFLEEARTLARFKHSHLNKVYRFFEDNGTAYIVLEYIEGETLSQILRREGQLDAARLERLLKELLSGLEEMHKAGFVHRDIKPGNIMLRENGAAVLLDFGAARQAIGQRSKYITSILTPGYAPIEQYSPKGDDIGPWTDLYALGMVAYRCISGIADGALLDAAARARLARKSKKGTDLAPAVELDKSHHDSCLLKAVDWCIQVYGDERPQNTADMREVLAGNEKPVRLKKHAGGRDDQETEVQCKRFVEVFGREPSLDAKDADGLTDLHYAAAAGMSALARFLLDAGADVHARMKEDENLLTEVSKRKLRALAKTNIFDNLPRTGTPLHWAAWKNARDTAELLLSRGADIHATDKDDLTPLHWAVRKNARDTAQLLISRGADLHENDKYGNTPLHWAVRSNACDAADLLISHGADFQAKNKYGRTPLHWATRNNACDAAQLLISHGADVQATDKNDLTPLHWAAWKNARDAAELLISREADLQATDKDDLTPLHWAAKENAQDTAELLISRGADIQAKRKEHRWPSYWTAVEMGMKRQIHITAAELNSLEADIRTKAEYGDTPLHWAALHNARDTAQLLISRGADIQAKDEHGHTPLHCAARNNACDAAELLISLGADIHAKKEDGDTPLHWAARHNSRDTAQLLISHGAHIQAKDNNGRMPLHRAAGSNARDTTELLISLGADVQAKDNNGSTSLHDAAWGNAPDAAQLLISHGADIHAKDKGGNTPLYDAAMQDARGIVELLISLGADVHAKGVGGFTPLRMAADKNVRKKALILNLAPDADVAEMEELFF